MTEINEEYERALSESYRLDDAFQKGWDDARGYYRKSMLDLLETYGHNGTLSLDYEEIKTIFEEVPENEMELLYKAALNRGRP